MSDIPGMRYDTFPKPTWCTCVKRRDDPPDLHAPDCALYKKGEVVGHNLPPGTTLADIDRLSMSEEDERKASNTPRTDAAAVDLSEDCENPCYWVSDAFARALERELAAMTDARDYEKAAHQRTRDFYERAKKAQTVDSIEDAIRRLFFSGGLTVRLSEACIQRLQAEERDAIGPELERLRIERIRAALHFREGKL